MSKNNLSKQRKFESEKILTNSYTPPQFTCPAISVIIPLYNVEKYIGECLDSLLAQTFQNFEVIVVDDCSIDKSFEIVKSYEPKFSGRLKIIKTLKNSGSGTEPRNIGFQCSRGEYIFLIDNDDLIMPTAFEELYEIAEFYKADVIQCESFYNVPENFIDNVEFRKNLRQINHMTGENLMREPLVWENNFEERIHFFAQRRLLWNYWLQFIRRDFIVKNSIKMIGVMADDMLFTICELCCAEKYVIIPKILYFYRTRNDSLIHTKFELKKQLNLWITMLKEGIKYLDKFLADREFFSHRADLKYILFDTFAQEMFTHLNEIYAQIPAHLLDELLRKEFGADSAFESFVFNIMNVQRLQMMQMQYQFNQFAAQAQKRIAELENELRHLQR